MHFKETAPDFARAPTLGQGLSGDFVEALAEEKAKGVERTATANITEVIRREDFFSEMTMTKTVPPSEC